MAMQSDMRLSDLLSLYLAGRDTSQRYRESLLRTVRKADRSGVSHVTDLKPAIVNRFLASLSTGATTRQNVRREILTLWRWAFEEGITDEPPLRVMKIRAKRQPVQAWALSDLRRMLDLAEQDETHTGGRHSRMICDWMPGWLSIGYDTGLRLGDLLALTSRNVCNGMISTVANKTGKPLVRPLSDYGQEQAIELIDASPDESLFCWFLTRRRAILSVRAFLDRHGYDGSTKYLRRTCATYLERNNPGQAWRYLQHSVPTLVERHYVDASLCPAPAGPPPIKCPR